MMRRHAKASYGGAGPAARGASDPDWPLRASTSNIPTNPVAYDGDNKFETDPEIVRSEMMFYSTPLTEKYSAAAYGAIRNIQEQCATDFQNVCPTESPFVSFNSLFDRLFAPTENDFVFRRRKLADAVSDKHFRNGAEFVEYLRSLHSPRSLPQLLHPLSAVMYRDEKTKTYARPRTDKIQPASGKLSSQPRSHATPAGAAAGGGHHVRVGDTHRQRQRQRQRQRRRLRSAMDAPQAQPQPRGTADFGVAGSAEGAQGVEAAPAAQPVLQGFSQLVLDFLNGRDLTLFLDSRSGYLSWVPVYSVTVGDDDGDDGAAYYAADDDNNDDDFIADDDNVDDRGDDDNDDGGWALGEDDAYYAYDDDGSGSGGSPYYSYYDDASPMLPEGGDDFYAPGPANRLSKATPCGGAPVPGAAVRENFFSRGPSLSFTAQKADDPVSAVNPAAAFTSSFTQKSPLSPLLGVPHPLLRGWGVDGEAGHEEGDGPDLPHLLDHHPHKQGGDSSSSSSDEHEGHHHHGPPEPHGPPGPPGPHGPHGPPPPPPPPDRSFAGSLGYGAEGDSCLYRGIAQGRVSDGCVGAVAELYDLRAQYWEESQAPSGHHCGGLLLLLALVGGALLGCLIRRWRTRKHRRDGRSLLTALHTHPALKASVEAETGLSVPLPHPEPACCSEPGQAGRCTGSKLARACKLLAAFAGLLVVSFAVSVSSLHITQHLVRYLDQHAPPDPVTGDPQYTSIAAALLILLMVCTAQITLIALAVRALRACCAADKNGDSSLYPPAAASTPDGGASGVRAASAAPSATMTEGAAQWLQRHLSRLSARFGQSGAARDGYIVLPGGDDDGGYNGGEGDLMLGQMGAPVGGTEMVTFAATRPSAPPVMVAQQVQHPPQAPPQQQQQRYAAVLVPVTAMPVNTVSMV